VTRMELRLNLRNKSPSDEVETKARVEQATKRKAEATTQEPIEDAWRRIFAMKLTDADQRKLAEVRDAMNRGLLGRNPAECYTKSGRAKSFSKAEALRLYSKLAEQQRIEKLAELVAKTPSNYRLVDTVNQLHNMIFDIQSSELIAIDCETFGDDGGALDPWRGEMAGFSVSTRKRSYYVPIKHEENKSQGLTEAYIISEIKEPLESTKTVMHNAPFDCKWFYVKHGVNLINNLHADTRIMAMALDENRSHRLKDLTTDWLRDPSDNFDELFGKTPFNKIPLDVALPYAAGDTEKTLKVYDWMMRHLNSDKLAQLRRLIFEIEMPVARQFIWSDLRGIKFDIEAARILDAKFEKEEAQLIADINEIFGEEINLNSPIQLKKKLFDDLRLTDVEKGSTGVKVLKRIKHDHPVIAKILEYREVGKLRQAFTQKLPNDVKADGKIHPWHNTFGAATGRFTCKDPNTQQIPAKRPEVRKLFTATNNDRILVSIDYSQIELRVLAHMANEPELIRAFHEGRDIHSTTASMISNGQFTYEEIEVNKDTEGHKCQKLRKQAKVVNFGIVYGMSATGLSNTLEITKAEAQLIINNYFKGYVGIESYMNEQKQLARKQGFVTDIFGRKRRLHADYKSKDRYQQFRADRMAGNFPIQASAGSILKKAIVDLQPVLPKLDSHILLQVHDELVFDCPRNISREDLYRIKTTMEKTVKLAVPIRCDIEINPERWLEKIDESEWFSGKL
jgi:DNA polymerase-1